MPDHDDLFQRLEAALLALKAGDASAAEDLRQIAGDLVEGDKIEIGTISDAVGVAIGRNIQMTINHEAVSGELEAQLRALLDMLTQRRFSAVRRHVRVFLSSPGDVGEERALARKVISDLAYDPLLKDRVSLEVVAWDRTEAGTPMIASMTPQEAINRGLAKPSETDIVIVILWSRMGTPLSEEYVKPERYRFPVEDGWEDWRYLSGTEWEYIDAMEQARRSDLPYVLVYRREESPVLSLDDPAFEEKRGQYKRVKAFFTTFTNPDGTIRQGVNSYTAPSDFEAKFSEHLRDLIARLLVEMERSETGQVLTDDAEPVELWEGSPFPGLRAFGPEDAPIFYGRGAETDDLVARLGESQMVAVVGASGSGKSSLVGAGLLPRLAGNAIPGSKDWLLLRFTPDELGGGDPFAALTAVLRADPLNLDQKYLADHLRQNPARLVGLLHEALAGQPAWAEVLLFIDQFEELFTRANAADRSAFTEMLAALVAAERIRVVLTLRADFYARCVEVPLLADLLKRNTYPLSAPRRDALRAMIERPAERAGLRFEPGLVTRILDDTGDDPGALALLAFALQQLYDGRQGEELTLAAYEGFGGVQGAIGQQAQAAFDALDEAARAALPPVFRELIEVSAQGTPTRRRADLEAVTMGSAAARLVAEMTERRLLVQGRGESGRPVVEVAHEALFRSWERLARWVRDMGEDLAYGGELLRDLRIWQAAGRHPDYLLRGSQVDRATEWLIRAGANALVNEEQEAYIAASRAERERQQAEAATRQRQEVRRLRTFVAALSIVGVLLFGAAVIAVLLGFTSSQNAQEAEQNAQEAAEAQARAEQNAANVEQLLLQLGQFVEPEELAQVGVIANVTWTPVIREFNGVAMALVPAGCFQMGSDDGNSDESPVHEVCFEEPFWIDLTEVTNTQFAAFNGQAEFSSIWTDGERPRENITWTEAAAFCELRGARLPSEAEWEYAARGPDGLVYPWGDEFVSENAVWNSSATASVGSKPAGVSWVGALDMSGNVYEWVNDWYGAYPAERQVNPQGADTGTYRVLRGGLWNFVNSYFLRGADRYGVDPSSVNNFVGFRCALSY